MPRQARRKSESGIYHIMLRGINQQQIFEDSEDCEKFLQILKDCGNNTENRPLCAPSPVCSDIENATEEIREDMLYNHWSKQEIKQNVSSIGDNMFEKNGQEISVSDRKNSLVDMTTTYFANKTFEPIIKDMINHFMNETDDNFYGMFDGYNLYSNSDLTEQVKSHSESEDYINKNKTALNRCLKNFNGSICNLKYNPSIRHDKDLRKSHPFVAMADSMGIKLPVFDDMFKGFKICIDSLQGAKIEILSYNLVGNSYSGKMKITYYDHFGLDVADLNKDGFAGIGRTQGTVLCVDKMLALWYRFLG